MTERVIQHYFATERTIFELWRSHYFVCSGVAISGVGWGVKREKNEENGVKETLEKREEGTLTTYVWTKENVYGTV